MFRGAQRRAAAWRRRRDITRADIGDRVWPFLAAVTAAGAPVLWDLVPKEGSWSSILTNPLTIIFGVITVAALGFTILAGQRSLFTRRRARRELSSFSYSLDEATAAVQTLLSSDSRRSDGLRYIDEIASVATKMMPLRDVRATIYELESTDSEDGTRRLVRVGRSRGRNDQAREKFSSADDHGRELIEIVEARTPRYIENYRDSEITYDRDVEAFWECYVVLPLESRGAVWGALLLDSVTPNEFTRDQKNVALAIARFLELGLECVVEAATDNPSRAQISKLESDIRNAGVPLPAERRGRQVP